MATDNPMPRDPALNHQGHDPGPASLSGEEFARRFQASGSLFWSVAAGVLGNPSEVDDVLQEAGMMAYSKLDQFQPGTHFEAWMSQFVRHVALNLGRRRRLRQHQSLEFVGEELLSQAACSEFRQVRSVSGAGKLHPEQEAFDDQVLSGLRELSAMQRTCLLLRSVQEFSYHEIAQALGIPEGTAMSHVHRARGMMRKLLGEGPAGVLGLGELG